MGSSTPSLRAWLLVSASMHAAVLVPGQFFAKHAPPSSVHGRLRVTYAPPLPRPELPDRPTERELSPLRPSPPLPEPEPTPYLPDPDDAPLLPRERPPLPQPLHDPELFASLGMEPLQRLRAAARETPMIAAPPEPDPTPPAFETEAGTPRASAPVALSRPPPVYPPVSLRLGEEGRVLLRIEIGTDGRVRAVIVEESSGYQRLDRAAVLAVGSWRFRPAQRAGTAVTGTVRQRITFRVSSSIR